MRCQINVEKGNVESFVIQYEILVANQWFPVTRFDTFHDGVHRDLIEPGGRVTKKWFLHLGFDEGLSFAYMILKGIGKGIVNDTYPSWRRSHEERRLVY